METLNLTFFDCVSHGYLQVSWTDFVNIFKKYDYYPSECSYKGRGYVYLEEDCDGLPFEELFKTIKDKSSRLVRSYIAEQLYINNCLD